MFYNNILPSRSFTEQDVNSQTEVGCTSWAVQGWWKGQREGAKLWAIWGSKHQGSFCRYSIPWSFTATHSHLQDWNKARVILIVIFVYEALYLWRKIKSAVMVIRPVQSPVSTKTWCNSTGLKFSHNIKNYVIVFNSWFVVKERFNNISLPT